MENELKALKQRYQNLKKIGTSERLSFLYSIVSYCGFIGFNEEKTIFMLAIIRNFLPEPGQSFTDCDLPDAIDIDFNKKMQKKAAQGLNNEMD